MSKLRVHSFSISMDGFGAGPGQDTENPLGVGGLRVFDWFFPTRTWQLMHGNEDGETRVEKPKPGVRLAIRSASPRTD